jgi:exopolysaccharide production protein ExoZ
MPKILGLELLRGMCALLVAFFHFLIMSGIGYPYSWGPYGVYIFFAISGAVLYVNYSGKISLAPEEGRLSVAQFLWRRFARLAPLIWAAMIVPALVYRNFVPDLQFLNLTLMHGFTTPGVTSYLMGSWSLGIEFLFYTLFPTLLALTLSWRVALIILVMLLGVRFALLTHLLQTTDFQGAAVLYTEPGAFLFFFFGGMLVAKALPLLPIRAAFALPVALLCAAGLFAIPAGSTDEIMQGSRGVGMTLLAVIIVAACAGSPRNIVVAAFSKFMGDVSYGLYLLHPLAWQAVVRYLPPMAPLVQMVIALTLTIGAAWVSFRFYERPVRRWLVSRW